MSGAIADALSKMVSAITEARIDKHKVKQVKAILEITDSSSPISCSRMVPRGGGQDSWEGTAWAPRVWLDAGKSPDSVRDLGAPWLSPLGKHRSALEGKVGPCTAWGASCSA